METKVTFKYYIVLDLDDGSNLYLVNDGFRKHWSASRSAGSTWFFPEPAEESLAACLEREDVPPSARVQKIKITVEEIK
jgi:hypothetical protein